MKEICYLSAVALLLTGCANQRPPEGGPVDTTTPRIMRTYPEDGTKNYSGNRIEIELDRYVDERSLEESVFISPYVGQLEFDWSGSDVVITFSEKLRSNTTYVVNIGTDVKDRFRNGRTMSEAYTLAFSTGSDIDRGAVKGMVFPEKEGDNPAGVMIFAYRIDGIKSDTLDPAVSAPDFITQTGNRGDFFLNHIPFGEYRIFAVRDEYRNLVYDRGTDEYGVQSGRIIISPSDTLAKGVYMKLAREDTTGPILVKVSATLEDHVSAEFSESIDPGSVTPASVSIKDTLDGRELKVLDIFPTPASAKIFVAITGKQDSMKTYNFTAGSVTDSIGNRINASANSFLFQGSSKKDTLGPHLVSVSIKDSMQDVDVRPEIELIFSDALAKTDSAAFLGIFDDKGKEVQVRSGRLTDILMLVTPEKELKSRTWYTLRADLRMVSGWTGKKSRDTVRVWHFETMDLEDLSSIEGSITGIQPGDAGKIKVSADRVGEKIHKSYTVTADRTGKFIFQRVQGGKYRIQAYRDANGNAKYDPGLPFPFSFSEQLSQFSDTLRVRARWPLDGVTIEIE